MDAKFEIVSGPATGRRIELTTSGVTRVGRTNEADFGTLDRFMSRLHFALEWDGGQCMVRDLGSSNGTQLNGVRLDSAVALRNGDRILAGQTEFVAHIREQVAVSMQCERITNFAPPRDQNQRQSVYRQPPVNQGEEVARKPPYSGAECVIAAPIQLSPIGLLQFLREQKETLFAILDAARDPKVLEVLGQSPDKYQSLYDGEKGDELAQYAPYLVQFSADSPLIETLASEGWGKAWGVYLTCNEPFDVVRRHLRHFLLVQAPDGRRLYFRFYDPRVLRTAISLYRPEEADRFFGPVAYYLVEDENSDVLLRFAPSPEGCSKREVPLLQPAPLGNAVPFPEQTSTVTMLSQE